MLPGVIVIFVYPILPQNARKFFLLHEAIEFSVADCLAIMNF
jgi:hypothetical protein